MSMRPPKESPDRPDSCRDSTASTTSELGNDYNTLVAKNKPSKFERRTSTQTKINVPSQPGTDVLCCGWLQKQGGSFAGWKKRFFELKPDGRLEYRRKERAELSGHIVLKGATLTTSYTVEPDGILEIASPLQSRVFYVKGNKSEFDRWREILTEQVELLPPPLNDDAPSSPQQPLSPHDSDSGDDLDLEEAPQRVYKCGWLQKRGRINRQFKKRWFILRNASLEYYKSHQDGEPQGVIIIAEGLSKIVPGDAPFAQFLEIYAVEGRVYTLASTSRTELTEWLNAIRARHSSSRLSEIHSISHAEKPSEQATLKPPIVMGKHRKSIRSTASFKKTLLRPLIRLTPHTQVCKLGCGGPSCKHCNPCHGKSEPVTSAIKGLNASWVTHNVIASTRPSDRLIDEYNIIQQFLDIGVTAIFNLQNPGEHADCGDGNVDGKWSYQPKAFFERGISVYLFSFEDFGVPTVESAFKMTKAMALETDYNGKCMVHCHAGHGRTGMLIACYLVYSLG